MIELIVCLIAGLGAGIGTGLSGLSAAAVIAPMLITFLGFNAYEAVGIALASDVLASAVSAYIYGKNRNVDLKNGWLMLIFVLLFTVIGSFVASLINVETMGSFSVIMTLVLGVKFVVKPVMTTKGAMGQKDKKTLIKQSILCGMMIGFVCGFVGAGGGMMMLLMLTSVLGYELKTAVGTSVFIMAFTAFTGAFSHFVIDGNIPNLLILSLCILFTFIGAQIAAQFANHAQAKTLNRATGIVLTVLGTFMVFVRYIFT